MDVEAHEDGQRAITPPLAYDGAWLVAGVVAQDQRAAMRRAQPLLRDVRV